jgi:acetyl esterase/lipase
VTKYIFDNPNEFPQVDLSKIILAGDSAGGNAVAVVLQTLIAEQRTQPPKLQILIYPWLQMINLKLTSHMKYFNTVHFHQVQANTLPGIWAFKM